MNRFALVSFSEAVPVEIVRIGTDDGGWTGIRSSIYKARAIGEPVAFVDLPPEVMKEIDIYRDTWYGGWPSVWAPTGGLMIYEPQKTFTVQGWIKP